MNRNESLTILYARAVQGRQHRTRVATQTSVSGVVFAVVAASLTCMLFAGAQVRADIPELFPPIRDRALAAGHYIGRFQARRSEQRLGVLHSMWRDRPGEVFAIRSEAECLGDLSRAGIRWQQLGIRTRRVPAAVAVQSSINGVRFRKKRPDAPLIVACELATRLHVLADIVARHGINEVEVMSAFRRVPTTSYHHVGLAIDVTRLSGENLDLHLIDHYQVTPFVGTCEGDPPSNPNAAILRAIACEAWETGVFSSVITPNYGRGHENHFHFDVRPNDSMRFLR